jgi:hypothetical protein
MIKLDRYTAQSNTRFPSFFPLQFGIRDAFSSGEDDKNKLVSSHCCAQECIIFYEKMLSYVECLEITNGLIIFKDL